MAPYISSHLCDSVWLAPPTKGAQLDILQNLEANTRMQRSAIAISRPSAVFNGSCPDSVWWITPSWYEDQCLTKAACCGLTQAGPPGTNVLAEWRF